jgi:hypothetical protein
MNCSLSSWQRNLNGDARWNYEMVGCSRQRFKTESPPRLHPRNRPKETQMTRYLRALAYVNPMKYLHTASNIQIGRLLDSGATIGQLMTEYKQPDWCGYPSALEGVMGCWSLMDLEGIRKRISRKFCAGCECYIRKN